MLLHAQSSDLLSCIPLGPGGVRLVSSGGQYLVEGGWHVAYGMWQVAGGRSRILAEIMTSFDMVVYTISSARPPLEDLTMLQGHGIDNCSLRF